MGPRSRCLEYARLNRVSPTAIDLPGWLPEPTATRSDRLPPGREPRATRATRQQAAAPKRRPAPTLGGQGQETGSASTSRTGHRRYAGDALGLAPETDRRKYDGSKQRGPGRPRTQDKIQQWVVHMATENRDWG